MVTNNVENAKKSSSLSDEVGKTAQKANDSMASLVKSMDEIMDSNEQIAKLVKVIGQIGKKTQVIDTIVFQTKLLSFNASVEAERAGEHGRGFAVVAQEVGNLAEMSGKAALEISTIVKDSIEEAESITSTNKRRVELGSNHVQETANLLKEISTRAVTVANNTLQIVVASEDQAKGIKQINNAVNVLDKATQDNACTAEEAASSSEELTAQAETLKAQVGELIGIVEGAKGSGTITGPVAPQPIKPPQATPKNVVPLKNFQQREKPPKAPKPQKMVAAIGKSGDRSSVDDKKWQAL